jgi:fatty-acyl-CoA synthase
VVAKFTIGEECKVFTEDYQEVEPGSGVPGFIARSGAIPVGYYKDEEKTAKTFPVINGVRYSIPGDWCTVEKDGTLTLLGRGSVCINSGGEKIYPEEVEETLKTHPAVEDVLVVGVPDEKWGQAVTGVVKLHAGVNFNEQELRDWVKERLAPYKAPKRVLPADIALRAANGKADYKGASNFAKSTLGIAS